MAQRATRRALSAAAAAIAASAYLPAAAGAWRPAVEATVAATLALLQALGWPAGHHGAVVVLDGFACEIDAVCAAPVPVALAVIAASLDPAPAGRRWVLGAALVALALALNLVRLASLVGIGARMPAAFAPAHEVIWPLAYTVALLAAWAGLRRCGAGADRSRAPLPRPVRA